MAACKGFTLEVSKNGGQGMKLSCYLGLLVVQLWCCFHNGQLLPAKVFVLV